MKLLIDECVLSKTARLLRENGFSVVTVQELGKMSATNGMVISTAKKEKAIIITNDLDFSNLTLYPLRSHGGIIVLRPRLDTPEAADEINTMLIKFLTATNPAQIEKALVIIDRHKYRIHKE